MNASKSQYYNYAPLLIEMGYQCDKLDCDQMNEVGMAAERAYCDWEWSTAEDEGCEDRISRIFEAKQNVEMCGAETEQEMVGAYVGGFYDDYNL